MSGIEGVHQRINLSHLDDTQLTSLKSELKKLDIELDDLNLEKLTDTQAQHVQSTLQKVDPTAAARADSTLVFEAERPVTPTTITESGSLIHSEPESSPNNVELLSTIKTENSNFKAQVGVKRNVKEVATEILNSVRGLKNLNETEFQYCLNELNAFVKNQGLVKHAGSLTVVGEAIQVLTSKAPELINDDTNKAIESSLKSFKKACGSNKKAKKVYKKAVALLQRREVATQLINSSTDLSPEKVKSALTYIASFHPDLGESGAIPSHYQDQWNQVGVEKKIADAAYEPASVGNSKVLTIRSDIDSSKLNALEAGIKSNLSVQESEKYEVLKKKYDVEGSGQKRLVYAFATKAMHCDTLSNAKLLEYLDKGYSMMNEPSQERSDIEQKEVVPAIAWYTVALQENNQFHKGAMRIEYEGGTGAQVYNKLTTSYKFGNRLSTHFQQTRLEDANQYSNIHGYTGHDETRAAGKTKMGVPGIGLDLVKEGDFDDLRKDMPYGMGSVLMHPLATQDQRATLDAIISDVATYKESPNQEVLNSITENLGKLTDRTVKQRDVEAFSKKSDKFLSHMDVVTAFDIPIELGVKLEKAGYHCNRKDYTDNHGTPLKTKEFKASLKYSDVRNDFISDMELTKGIQMVTVAHKEHAPDMPTAVKAAIDTVTNLMPEAKFKTSIGIGADKFYVRTNDGVELKKEKAILGIVKFRKKPTLSGKVGVSTFDVVKAAFDYIENPGKTDKEEAAWTEALNVLADAGFSPEDIGSFEGNEVRAIAVPKQSKAAQILKGSDIIQPLSHSDDADVQTINQLANEAQKTAALKAIKDNPELKTLLLQGLNKDDIKELYNETKKLGIQSDFEDILIDTLNTVEDQESPGAVSLKQCCSLFAVENIMSEGLTDKSVQNLKDFAAVNDIEEEMEDALGAKLDELWNSGKPEVDTLKAEYSNMIVTNFMNEEQSNKSIALLYTHAEAWGLEDNITQALSDKATEMGDQHSDKRAYLEETIQSFETGIKPVADNSYPRNIMTALNKEFKAQIGVKRSVLEYAQQLKQSVESMKEFSAEDSKTVIQELNDFVKNQGVIKHSASLTVVAETFQVLIEQSNIDNESIKTSILSSLKSLKKACGLDRTSKAACDVAIANCQCPSKAKAATILVLAQDSESNKEKLEGLLLNDLSIQDMNNLYQMASLRGLENELEGVMGDVVEANADNESLDELKQCHSVFVVSNKINSVSKDLNRELSPEIEAHIEAYTDYKCSLNSIEDPVAKSTIKEQVQSLLKQGKVIHQMAVDNGRMNLSKATFNGEKLSFEGSPFDEISQSITSIAKNIGIPEAEADALTGQILEGLQLHISSGNGDWTQNELETSYKAALENGVFNSVSGKKLFCVLRLLTQTFAENDKGFQTKAATDAIQAGATLTVKVSGKDGEGADVFRTIDYSYNAKENQVSFTFTENLRVSPLENASLTAGFVKLTSVMTADLNTGAIVSLDQSCKDNTAETLKQDSAFLSSVLGDSTKEEAIAKLKKDTSEGKAFREAVFPQLENIRLSY